MFEWTLGVLPQVRLAFPASLPAAQKYPGCSVRSWLKGLLAHWHLWCWWQSSVDASLWEAVEWEFILRAMVLHLWGSDVVCDVKGTPGTQPLCWFYFRLCVYVYVYVWVCAYECSVCGGQKRAWIPWSCSYMLLGAELWSFGKTASSFNPHSVSPAPVVPIFKMKKDTQRNWERT